MKRILSFIYKEFLHIIRDPRTMLILLAMPIIEIVLFGFALSTEVKNARVALLDPAKDAHTQRIVEKIESSQYFSIVDNIGTPQQIDELFRRGDIDLALVFDRNYAENPKIQILADGSDPNTAIMATNYMTAIISSGSTQQLPITSKLTYLYNPSMKSSYDFVPGVMGLVMMLICAMMTSISIVREKERGTMEVLLVSPIHPLVIILAKVIPYFILSIIDLTIILSLAVFLLDVPISGSLLWLILFSLLFIFVVLSLGLLISTLVESQVTAMLLAGMVLMMPTTLLSGMMFPVENMPLPLRIISSALPARWYIDGVRKLMIEGVEVRYVLREFLILGAMGVVLIAVSLKKFKIRL